MTQVERPRLKSDLRWGRIYGWDVIDHTSWVAGSYIPVKNDYVGQTRQKGRARENQHRDSQPWSDLTIGSPRTLWEGWCTDEDLDEMERRFIQDPPSGVRPRLNYLLNEDNPHRVPKWTLLEQRHQRDDRNGVPRWEPTPYRPETYGYRPAPQQRTVSDKPGRSRTTVKVRRQWRTWQKHLLAYAITVAVLTFAGWAALAHYGRWETAQLWRIPAAVAAVLLWGWLGFPFLDDGAGKRWKAAQKRLRGKRR